jgi:hypothetical protein
LAPRLKGLRTNRSRKSNQLGICRFGSTISNVG